MNSAGMDSARETGDRPTVLVLGGRGFIGRHVVAALQRERCKVIVGSRQPQRRLQPSASDDAVGMRRIHMHRLLEPTAWLEPLRGCDVVVNCVGILRERGGERYAHVHHLGPAALAAACAARGTRLIHVSALGLQAPVRSGFLRSKRDGETALKAAGGDWAIVRPSLLDGDGGFGARWVRRVARWPVHLLPADARGRIAALDVGELGEAIARLALVPDVTTPGVAMPDVAMPDVTMPDVTMHVVTDRDSSADAREFELGGLHPLTLAEHLAAMRRLHTSAPARCLRVPAAIARLVSHVCDLLHVTPYSFGHLELLRHDNCPRRNRLPELLGRVPRTVGIVASTPPMPAAAGLSLSGRRA